MSGEQPNNSSPETEQLQPVETSFATFFEAMPPSDQFTLVTDALEPNDGASRQFVIAAPALYLHCSSEICKGDRIYRFEDGNRYLSRQEDAPTTTYLTYLCSNCRQSTKLFSFCVQTSGAEAPAALCAKFGEIPLFGSPTPNTLLRLLAATAEFS